jgi:hypothetical protein
MAKELMLLAPRSVTTSVRPSGLKAIWAGSAPSFSSRIESSSGVRPSSAILKPLMFGVPPLLST